MKKRLCTWNCQRFTTNTSGICDYCWKNHEAIFQVRIAKETTKEKSPARIKAGKALAAYRKAHPKPAVLQKGRL